MPKSIPSSPFKHTFYYIKLSMPRNVSLSFLTYDITLNILKSMLRNTAAPKVLSDINMHRCYDCNPHASFLKRDAVLETDPLFSLLLVTNVSPLFHFLIVLAGFALTKMILYHLRLAYRPPCLSIATPISGSQVA